MTGADILAAARACLDTPFRHQGRVPGLALDCAGLIVSVAQALGIDHCDVADYGRLPNNGQLAGVLDAQPALRAVVVADMQPGDILLMRFVKEPQHLAFLGESTLIHSWEGAGKVCEHGIDDIWRRRIVRVYRFAGVANEQ